MKNKKILNEYLFRLGHRLRIIRSFLKLDQKQMSELLDTTQPQISKLEAGRSAPTLHQLLKIKELAEKDDYLRNNLTWNWILQGRGKGLI